MTKPATFEYELVGAINQPAKSLIVIFHGHGGRAQHFMTVAHAFRQAMPDTDIICLNGPVGILLPPEKARPDGGRDGRTWLAFNSAGDLAKISLSLLFNRISIVRDINTFIDTELKKRGLREDRLALFGFSMGGGIALVAGQSRHAPCAGIVSHSGVYFRYPHIRSRPETLLIMGTKDYLYDKPPAAATLRDRLKKIFSYQYEMTVRRLNGMGIPFRETIIQGLEHNTSPLSVAEAIAFLRPKLGYGPGTTGAPKPA